MSPRPTSFSAPVASRMMRDSSEEATAKAMRLGILAFIRPVMTSADGRWVAMTRCIPAARPICATRQMDSSTSFAATSIRSASSSMTTTTDAIWASSSPSGPFRPDAATALYSSSFFTPSSEKVLYRFIISKTAHCSAPAAFFGSVTTGMSRWGMPL